MTRRRELYKVTEAPSGLFLSALETLVLTGKEALLIQFLKETLASKEMEATLALVQMAAPLN